MHRAANTGVPPADPTLHRVALDLARYQLAEAIRQRTGMVAAFLLVLGASLLFGVTDRSVWFTVLAVLLGARLVQTVAYPALQGRRIAKLESAYTLWV